MEGSLDNHVLVINSLGDAIDTDTNKPIKKLDDYLDKMIREIQRKCDGRADEKKSESSACGREESRKILIHVHGGLNTHQNAKAKAHRITQMILAEDGGDWHYPIFITWPSGGIGSYCEHLFFLRRGRRAKKVGILLFPFYLVTDLFKGFARTLVSVPLQVSNDFSALVYSLTGLKILPSWRNSDAIYKAAINSNKTNNAAVHNIVLGRYSRTPSEKVWRFCRYIFTFPFKLMAQIIVLDAAAEGAWNAMLHRIRNLFRKPREFDVRGILSDSRKLSEWLDSDPSGALVRFWNRLDIFLEGQANEGKKYEIVLVGHSMGAIVINQSLRYISKKFISRIVYMAPASTIRETSDSLIPVLLENPGTNFHLLVLHPMAEIEEVSFSDFIPRGSLLEWIDNWYTTPPSHTHRRLGKWINVTQALHLFKDVRGQVTLKGFDAISDHMPQKHGEFNDCPFWQKEFWEINEHLSYSKDWASNYQKP
jgi:hypothetical protein